MSNKSKWIVTHDQKSIASMLQSIKARAGSMLNDVQICAVSCVLHALEHGNVTPATQLCEALGSSWKVGKLRSWFYKHGPFKSNADRPSAFMLDGARKVAFMGKCNENRDAFIAARLDDVLWQVNPRTLNVKEFDLAIAVGKLVRKAEKHGQANTVLCQRLKELAQQELKDAGFQPHIVGKAA